jgi:hypothetical protein
MYQVTTFHATFTRWTLFSITLAHDHDRPLPTNSAKTDAAGGWATHEPFPVFYCFSQACKLHSCSPALGILPEGARERPPKLERVDPLRPQVAPVLRAGLKRAPPRKSQPLSTLWAWTFSMETHEVDVRT